MRVHVWLPITTVFLLGCALASLPCSSAPNRAGSPALSGHPNVVVKVVPVYIKPYSPTVQTPPPTVNNIPSGQTIWDRLGTALLILATLAQAVVAGFLYNAAHRQAKAAKEQVTAAKEQAAAAKEQVKAAKEQAAAAKEQVKATREETAAAKEQVKATREQLAEAKLLRRTSERPMLSLTIFDDRSLLDNHQHTVTEETGRLLLATHTTIIANNHGTVPSYDTNVTVRIRPDARGLYPGFCVTLPFNVVPAGQSVATTVPIFERRYYDMLQPASGPVTPLEVQLSATYRNTYDTFFKLAGGWTVQPFGATESRESFFIRFSWWHRAANETVAGITQEEAIRDACKPSPIWSQDRWPMNKLLPLWRRYAAPLARLIHGGL